jgi:hypothetical protein
VNERGDRRQRLLFEVASELCSRERVSLGELLVEFEGEDLDRMLQAIAMVDHCRLAIRLARARGL